MRANIEEIKDFLQFIKYYNVISVELIRWTMAQDMERWKIVKLLRLADKYERIFRASNDTFSREYVEEYVISLWHESMRGENAVVLK